MKKPHGIEVSTRRKLTFLRRAEAVTLVETHISWLLLTGTVAYKIKRPVHFPFVDLRSPARRTFLCGEEVRLNRRFAPEVYLGVSRITSDAQGARMDGEGQVIESCVRMQQFDSQAQLDHLLARGAIEPAELFNFGRDLARTHAKLPTVDSEHDRGRAEAVRASLLRNFDECVAATRNTLPAGNAAQLRACFDDLAKSASPWMDRRRTLGRVKECHGDLHCSNLVRFDGRVRAFDCLEFDPAMRWIDVADEISFLIADLAPYDSPSLQQAFLSGYLLESGDYDACRFMFVYRAHRCFVRAKVLALSGEGGSAPAFIEAARRALAPRQGVLILMSGLSGSGKSWLAQKLAPALGAVHIRSDVERKRLAGIDIDTPAPEAPGGGKYSAQSTQHLYDHLLEAAEALLRGGYTVIVDATFILRRNRRPFLDLASRLNVPMRIVCCEAPLTILKTRIEERARHGGDPSDADASVLQWQMDRAEPFDADEIPTVLRVRSEESGAFEEVRRQLELLMPRFEPFHPHSV